MLYALLYFFNWHAMRVCQRSASCLLLALSMLLYMYESKRLCMYVCVCVHSERMFVAVGMLQALFSLKA